MKPIISFLLIIMGELLLSSAQVSRPNLPPATDACPNPISLGTTRFEFQPFTVYHQYGCVCTNSSCGTYPIEPVAPSPSQALIVTTSETDGMLSHQIVDTMPASTFNGSAGGVNAAMDITVRPENIFQEVFGLGASITDAVAYVLTDVLKDGGDAIIDQVVEQAFLHSGFSLTRVPMGSADFSRMNYALSYNASAPLSDFCLRDDTVPEGDTVICGVDYKLDILERMVDLAQHDLKIIASAWSAAPSFKTQKMTCDVPPDGLTRCYANSSAPDNIECIRTVADPNTCIGQDQSVPCPTSPPHNYSSGFPQVWTLGTTTYNAENIPSKNSDGNCFNQGLVQQEAYEAWAQVYAAFIEAYGERLGVPVWGVTSQNEPYTQTGLWGANFWTVEGIAKFVNDHLSPAVKAVNQDIKVMVYDDQTIDLATDAREMMRLTIDSADAVAYHWYSLVEASFENSTASVIIPGLNIPPTGGGLAVRELYEEFKDEGKFMAMTEMCSGYLLGTALVGPLHGSYQYGYNVAHDILWQFRNRNSLYIYWNLILDSLGGPNLAGNYVDSPMWTFNSTAFVENPSYFYITHFSRFVPPGSYVVDADVNCGADNVAYCQYVAFLTPNEDVVVVLTNDEIVATVQPSFLLDPIAKGQKAPIDWSISCGDNVVNGTLPWESIQTVVMKCPGGIPPSTKKSKKAKNEKKGKSTKAPKKTKGKK